MGKQTHGTQLASFIQKLASHARINAARHKKILLPAGAALTLCLLAVAVTPATAPPRTPWQEGHVLRVGSPEPVRQATVISPYGPGFEFELVNRFCSDAPCTPEWVNVANKDEGFALLEKGEIHVLVGFWGDAPQKAAATATAAAPSIAGGKAYAHFNPVRVKGAAAPKFTPADEGPKTDSSVMDALARLFAFIRPAQTGRPADETPFPVFSLVMDGGDAPSGDIVLVDPASYALWLPFMGDVDTKQVRNPTPYRWFWLNNGSEIAASLETFWKQPARTAELQELTERYFGFLPRTLRQRDVLELSETLAARLPQYGEFIRKAAKETGVPPLLLVATIYQESRFDATAVSETNVRGIMQLTTNTARMLEVDRKDPEQCIMGGARYIRELYDKVGDKAENDWDRWFMALAAYNQGMSNLNRAISLSKNMGGKGTIWADLKRSFPLSTTCRGTEARFFVERIRYYHFILHGLVALAPSEAQDLAPLLGLALAEPDL